MSEKKYADGVRFFERKDNQPDFVLGALVITPEKIQAWSVMNSDLLTEYQGNRQVKFQVKRSRDGKVYIELDTYKPGSNGYTAKAVNQQESEDLPF